jgi:hypothetical protein
MDESQLQSVRRFNRLVTQRVGAIEVDYLRRGRPLAQARLILKTAPVALTPVIFAAGSGWIPAISAACCNP